MEETWACLFYTPRTLREQSDFSRWLMSLRSVQLPEFLQRYLAAAVDVIGKIL